MNSQQALLQINTREQIEASKTTRVPSGDFVTDILLVTSPTNARSPYMPFYYLYLAGYLEAKGYRVEIADPHERTLKSNIKLILEKVKQTKPRFVGLAAFVTDYNVMVNLAKSIRNVTLAPIIIGNAHPSVTPSDFLYPNSPFDIAVCGEGEATCEEILERYHHHDDLGQIKGLAYLSREDKVVVTPERRFLPGNEWGKPAYHLLDMEFYSRPTKYLIRNLYTRTAVIYTARGCPFKCGFCAANAVWEANSLEGSKLVRNRPMESVMEELALLQNHYKFDFFYILDDTFGLREKDVYDFCDAYKKSGLKMLWGAETRVTCVRKKEVLIAMKNAGCIQLDFGVETGSPTLLKTIDKAIKVENILLGFKNCHEVGMRSFANMLINLPGETTEDLDLTYKLLRKIKPTYTSFGVTQPYPGTPFYKKGGFTFGKEAYHKLDREVPPEEFRMAQHKLPLEITLLQFRLRFQQFGLVEQGLFKGPWRYWTQIFRSARRRQYLWYFIKQQVNVPVIFARMLFRYYKLVRTGESAASIKKHEWQVAAE